MNDRESSLILNLREAARIIRTGGDVHSDYFTKAADFASEIESLANLIERSAESPLAYIRALFARKRAKLTWCSPTFDLDDYLAGTNEAAKLGTAIYESL